MIEAIRCYDYHEFSIFVQQVCIEKRTVLKPDITLILKLPEPLQFIILYVKIHNKYSK